MSEVTLFIEDTSIKLLVAKGRRVEKWAVLPLEPGQVSDGLIHDEAHVADRIKQIIKEQKANTGTATVALGGFNSVFRVVSLPQLPEAIIPEAAKQEASRVIPVPMDQVYLSYQVVPSPPGETRLFLAAFPKNATDNLIQAVQKAGLRVDLLDLAPLALCRTVDAPKAVIVDVRSSSLDIAILVDRVPEVTRSLSLPGEAQTLEERLPAIAEELERTIAFYNAGHKDSPLAETVPVFVTGDLANAPDTWSSLGGTAGHPVSALSSPMLPSDGFDPSQFMVNIGLALKRQPLEKEGANFSVVNFNALPIAEKPKKASSPLNVVLPIVIVLGIGGLYYMYNQVRNTGADTEQLRTQSLALQQQIPQLQSAKQAIQSQIDELTPQLEPLRDKASALESNYTAIESGRNRLSQDITQIAQLTPDEIALIYGGNAITGKASPASEASIGHTTDQATVEGKSQTLEAIFKYARDLRASGFSQVIISSINAYENVIESDTGESTESGYNFQFLLLP
jgi:type IV pilus assembly protein PilM